MRSFLVALALLGLAGCGAEQERGPATPTGPPPYTDTATGRCLEEAGYAVLYEHGDPRSGRPENVVFDVWLEQLGSTTISFYHPSREPAAGGERYGNAVLVLDPDFATSEDRGQILACLR